MQYLLLSILFSSFIFVIFKLYTRFKIETLYAIITNYVVACIVGLLFYEGKVELSSIPQKNWFLGAMALGVLFILVFNIMAATSQKLGVSVASVATKMSFVLPAFLGVFLYNEYLGSVKIIGIIIAVLAVYFVSVKRNSDVFKLSMLTLPFLVFLGSGAIDTAIKFFQELYVPENEFALFSATVFATAAVVGLIFILANSRRKPVKVNFRNIGGGILLGVPNFFSIYFLLKALDYKGLSSASIFTLNNVGIVMLSTFLGILLFKEKLESRNWLGIGLAIISILLVAFS
ncbi:DMT family transporter [Maribacter sp. MJ134]|uniref:EamA family transporter n=1 Tax=Maribacter sp. MJ134 TaxID=2496865 RepID=UPI000F836A2B|nr:EamA family transporter [Maribacter sp. MJ134]AZQ57958.1 DMT family transporter [Maribacter sp. MJ134]